MELPSHLELRHVVESNGCWRFIGSIHPTTGYGRVSYRGKWYSASRVAYKKHNEKFDETLFVCHTCDNRKCVNPDHLFLGTNEDNHKDMWAKNRGKTPQVYRGEKSPTSKLTDAEREEIKGFRQLGWTLETIATLYGVGISTIHRIVKDN